MLAVFQYTAIILFLVAAWHARISLIRAWKGEKITPIDALEIPTFFLCIDVAYNVLFFRLWQDFGLSADAVVAFMTAGALAHCVVAAKIILAFRAVRSWNG